MKPSMLMVPFEMRNANRVSHSHWQWGQLFSLVLLLKIPGQLLQQCHHDFPHASVMPLHIRCGVFGCDTMEEMVAASPCTLHQQLPTALQMEDPGIARHNWVSSSSRSLVALEWNSGVLTGVPKIFRPSRLHSHGPKSSIRSGISPSLFHVRVFPVC